MRAFLSDDSSLYEADDCISYFSLVMKCHDQKQFTEGRVYLSLRLLSSEGPSWLISTEGCRYGSKSRKLTTHILNCKQNRVGAQRERWGEGGREMKRGGERESRGETGHTLRMG